MDKELGIRGIAKIKDDKEHAFPYMAVKRRLVKCGISISTQMRTIKMVNKIVCTLKSY